MKTNPSDIPPTAESASVAENGSDLRLRAIFNTAVEGMIIIDECGRIDSVNPAAERMFGWPSADLVGQNIRVLMPEPFHSEHDMYLTNYLETGRRKIIGIGREARGKRRDGTVFPIDLSVGEFVVRGHRMFTGIIRDITERHRLQAEVLRIAEMEQQRLGRDLHDDLCQQLAGIEFLCQGLLQQLEGAKRPEAAVADEITRLIRAATEHTRALSHGMGPVPLEANGLTEALEGLAVRTQRRFQIPVHFRCPHPVHIPNAEWSTHLYRIAQEAVTNAVKHGRPTVIEIGLASSTQRIHLAVRDNGRGLPKSPGNGMGLRIMQYRAGMIGGSLVIQRDPNGGTIVGCSLHLTSDTTANLSSSTRAYPMNLSKSDFPKSPLPPES